jgi:hypothetical protein
MPKRAVFVLTVNRTMPGHFTIINAAKRWGADMCPVAKWLIPNDKHFCNKFVVAKKAMEMGYTEVLQLDDDVVVSDNCEWPGIYAGDHHQLGMVRALQEQTKPWNEGRIRRYNDWRVLMGESTQNPAEANKHICNSGILWYRPHWAWNNVFAPGLDLYMSGGPKGDQECISAIAEKFPNEVLWLPERFNAIWGGGGEGDPPTEWSILHCVGRAKARMTEVLPPVKEYDEDDDPGQDL